LVILTQAASEPFVSLNVWTAIFTLVNLLVLFIVMKKYLFGPVKKMIDERQQEIDDLYADANQSKADAAELKDQYETRLAEANEEKEEILHACQHVYENRTETPAGCETDGCITETCSVCGYVREETLPSPGHDLTVMMDVPASCDGEGYYRAECRVCDHRITESRPALGHTYIIKEETGTHVIKSCVRCQAEITEEVRHRNILTIFQNPVTAAVMIVILIQLIAIPTILLHHRHHQNKQRAARLRRTAHLYEEETDTEKPKNLKQ